MYSLQEPPRMYMGRRIVKTVHSLILLLIISTSTALSLGGTPPFPDPWTSRSRHDAGLSAPEKSSSSSEMDLLDSNSRARLDLEGKAAREIRESFGDEFARCETGQTYVYRSSSSYSSSTFMYDSCTTTDSCSNVLSTALHRYKYGAGLICCLQPEYGE